jgi:hypothetical protein
LPTGYAGCVRLVEAVATDIVRINGSHAQREVLEDTLVVALMRGELAKARALVEQRLRRRPALARADRDASCATYRGPAAWTRRCGNTRRSRASVAAEPNHSNPGGLTQCAGTGSQQSLNTFGSRGRLSASTVAGASTLMDWASAATAAAATAAPTTTAKIKGFIAEFPLPWVRQGRTECGARKA